MQNRTDWQSSTSSTATGELLVGTETVTVDVASTSAFAFVQTGTGTNYWTGSAYTDGTVENADSTGFQGIGELHGVILAEGDFSTISFTHTSEYWHGFTLGVEALAAPASVPAPATAAMLITLLLLARRRGW